MLRDTVGASSAAGMAYRALDTSGRLVRLKPILRAVCHGASFEIDKVICRHDPPIFVLTSVTHNTYFEDIEGRDRRRAD